MKGHKLYLFSALILVLSMLLGACARCQLQPEEPAEKTNLHFWSWGWRFTFERAIQDHLSQTVSLFV